MARGTCNVEKWPLPEGWEWKRLGKVVVKTERATPQNCPEQKFGYIEISSIDSQTGEIKKLRTLLGKDAPSRARKQVRTDDVIFATTRPYLRNIAIVPDMYSGEVCTTGFCVLRATREFVEPRWIYHLTRSNVVMEQVKPLMHGASYPAITDRELLSVEIPVPPLETQRRIVARIEELFAELDAARRIHAAFVHDAEHLFPAISSTLFASLIAEKQLQLPFAELIVDSRNGLYKPQTFYGSGTRIVRIDSFESGKIRRWGELKCLEVTLSELEKYCLQIGDVLVNRVNGSIDVLGKAVTVDQLPEPTVFESNIMRFRLNTTLVFPEFVVAFLSAGPGRVQIRAKARAIQQFSINQSDVGSIVVPVPSLPELRRIVAYLDEVQAHTAALRRSADAIAADLDRLEQSILAQAFQGKL